MKEKIIILCKLLLIGVVTTIVRIIGQLLIPVGNQNVLQPSAFVEEGILPLAFTIYGIIAYSIIASLFLLVEEQISGPKIIKGLKYSMSCCAVWVIYLLEPLPHVVLLDKFTYPVADSFALLIMGVLSGVLLCRVEGNNSKGNDFKVKHIPTCVITLCFAIGRFIQYCLLKTYSCFFDKKVETIIWVLATGIILAIVIQWLNSKVSTHNSIIRIIQLGVVLFGVNLTFFNFFIPLVFNADILDLLIRTVIDFGCVSIGCIALIKEKFIENP